MKPSQAAKLIGCGVNTITNAIRKDKIKADKVASSNNRWGYEYDIPEKEVLRYQQSAQHGGWPRGKKRVQSKRRK